MLSNDRADESATGCLQPQTAWATIPFRTPHLSASNTADQLRSARTTTKVMHGLSPPAEKTVHPTLGQLQPRFVCCIRSFDAPKSQTKIVLLLRRSPEGRALERRATEREA